MQSEHPNVADFNSPILYRVFVLSRSRLLADTLLPGSRGRAGCQDVTKNDNNTAGDLHGRPFPSSIALENR